LAKLCASIVAVLALVLAGTAAAGPGVGFSEDQTKYADDGGAALFAEMNRLGTTTNRVAVFWNAGAPETIQEQAFLDRMVPVAQAHRVQLVFALYPLTAATAPTTQAAADSFCDYAVKVMQRYPYVRKVIIGNEPNQPKFWQPIWNGSRPASPAAMEVVLAACYDRLKAFDASLQVIGVGLSPHGNDNPGASGNASLSPVRFIAALGEAYRKSGRTRPLFDTFAWHCHPNVNTDDVEVGYAWPNLGCANAARVKLALWDAFHGTAQPLPEAYPVATTGATIFGPIARMFVDEAGWDVDTGGLSGYVNAENVPVVTEAKQAESYDKLIHLANCERTLSDFNILHEIDETDRAGFQSGVLRVDSSERPAAAALARAVAADNGSCAGGVWQTLGMFLYSNRSVVPGYRTFPYRDPQPYARRTSAGIALGAGEGFAYSILFRRAGRTARVSGRAPATLTLARVPAGFGAGTAFVTLKALMNRARVSTVTLELGPRAAKISPKATKTPRRASEKR
jgi:hypothetical protein